MTCEIADISIGMPAGPAVQWSRHASDDLHRISAPGRRSHPAGRMCTGPLALFHAPSCQLWLARCYN